MDVDEALKKLSEMTLEDFEQYKPTTVSESMAFKLLKNAIESDDIKGIQVVLDRTQGRPTAKKQTESAQNDLIDLLRGIGK